MSHNSKDGKVHTFTHGNNSDERVGLQKKSPSGGEIQAWLISQLSNLIGIEPNQIDIRKPFSSYGLSSVQTVTLSGDLQVWLGRRLPPTLLFEYPSAYLLAAHLSGDEKGEINFQQSYDRARRQAKAISQQGLRIRKER